MTEKRLKQLRNFGLVMAGFLALVALSCWRHHRALPWPVPLGAGAAFLVGAFVRPEGLETFERPWMAFARVLGRINAAIILTVLYYLVVTPLAWLMRAMGNDPLELGRRGDTYWQRARTGDELARYEKQF